MKVNDLIQKCERDLTTAEITDMVAKDNRQVDLIFAEKRTDDAGYLTWDAENWTSVDGKRFIVTYSLAACSTNTAHTISMTCAVYSIPSRRRK